MSDIGSNDSFVETTHTSWFSRIGNSILGVLIGIVLLVVSIVLLFWNEGRAVQTARSLAEGRGAVVAANPAQVDPSSDGKLVHVAGEAKANAPLRDAEFGVTANGLRLVRTVQMYQWSQKARSETHKNLGGSSDTVTTYTYERIWSDHRIDSSNFRQPDGHANPQMRYVGTSVTARDATLGAFRPGEGAVRLVPASQNVQVERALVDSLRARVGGSIHLVDGKLYVGANPAEPRVGDLRISFSVAPNGPVSFIGRQNGDAFAEYQTQSGDRLLMARSGIVSASEMFASAEEENRFLTWILRAVGAAVMFFGFVLILSPLVVVADLVPLIGDILGAGALLVATVLTAVAAPLVIALAWMWFRPLVSIVVLGVGFGAAVFLRSIAARRSAARAQTVVPAQ